MKNSTLIILGILIILSSFCISCTTTATQNGAMGGGALGAIAGQLIGGNTESTLLGAGIGALGGALANDYVNQQKVNSYNQGYTQAGQLQYRNVNNPGTYYQTPQYYNRYQQDVVTRPRDYIYDSRTDSYIRK